MTGNTTVAGALNRGHSIGFDVSTTDGNMINVLSEAQIGVAGLNQINSIDFFVTGGPALVIPNFKSIDLLAADAAPTDPRITVTTLSKFAIGNWIWLYEVGTYTMALQESRNVATLTVAGDFVNLTSLVTGTYDTADTGTVAVIGDWNGYIPIDTGMLTYKQDGLAWKSLGIRKSSAADVRIRGVAVVV